MIRLCFTLANRLYWWLHHHAPSNRIVARAASRPSLAWTGVSLLLSILLLGIAVGVSAIVQHGGPGWLNLLVLWLVLDGVKMGCLAPVTLLRVARLHWTALRAGRAL